MVMRTCELIKQSNQLKIKSKIISNLFNEKHRLKLGEFNNKTRTERVNSSYDILCSLLHFCYNFFISLLHLVKCLQTKNFSTVFEHMTKYSKTI